MGLQSPVYTQLHNIKYNNIILYNLLVFNSDFVNLLFLGIMVENCMEKGNRIIIKSR